MHIKQNIEEAKVVLDCLLAMAANLFRNEEFRISQDLNCSLFLFAYLSKIVENVEAFLTRCNRDDSVRFHRPHVNNR